AQGGQAGQVTHNGGFVSLEAPDGKTLVYTRDQGGMDGLLAMPLTGGEGRQGFKDRIIWRGFAGFPERISYLSWHSGKDPGTAPLSPDQRLENPEIRFYDFASGRSQKLLEIGGPIRFSFAVSPDRKTFLFAKSTAANNLMMVENFR